MSTIYQPGDTVRLSTTFTVNDVLTDPTTVALVVRDPTGTSTSYAYNPGTITRDSVGAFHQDIAASTAGIYAWKWTGTGAAAGIDEGTFTVEDTLLGAELLCSVDDVKNYLELTGTDSDDLILQSIVAASSILPERYQREFIGPSGGTRTFSARGYLVDLAPYDLRTVTSVTLHPEETAQALTVDSDYLRRPQGGARLGGTYWHLRLSPRVNLSSTVYREFGEARLQVIGDWGCFSTGAVDASVKRAAVFTAAAWTDKAISEYGLAGEEPRELRPDRFATYGIPAAAHAILSPWGRLGTP
jgi:hypothetical protein